MSESKPRSRPPVPVPVPERVKDIAIVGGPTDDGRGARVLRIQNGNLSTGEIRPVREGEAITHSEVVRLRPLEGEPRVCEVEVLHEPPQTKSSDTPRRARVSTASYRRNWDVVFDSKKKRKGKDREWSVN